MEVSTPHPVALVTGARRGIGKAIAMELAQAGFDIAITDIHASDELDAACDAVRASGQRCIAAVADLGDIDTHTALFDAVEAQLGPVTCLVNNAGVSVIERGDILNVSPDSFDRCMAINTRGTFFLMQTFARRIVAETEAHSTAQPAPPATSPLQRSIVTITSSNAVAASPQRSEYCVSKAGLSMATTLFSLRLAELGIAVYEVQPGFIETEMTAPSRARYDAQMANGLTAMQRWGQPDEVARTVRTLATGGLPYSVGQAIRVDGGLLVHKY